MRKILLDVAICNTRESTYYAPLMIFSAYCLKLEIIKNKVIDIQNASEPVG